jgi:hypothetical protein
MNDMIRASKDTADTPASDSRLIKLTVADGLYLLIVMAAAIMRFVELGAIPLSPDEAQAAWASWLLWRPASGAIDIASPAYFTLTSLITPIAGYTDAVMRLVPAIFGLGTVALAWLVRHRLGTIGMLLFTLFLAISPLNAVAARTAGGTAIAQFSVTLMFVAWLHYQETAEKRWFYLMAAALGLGLSSSPLFYSGLLTIIAAGLVHAWIGPKWSETGNLSWPEAAVRFRAGLLGGTVFVITSALFLWYPAGLGASVALPAKWLSQFTFSSDSVQLFNPMSAAARYEPMLLLPGIAAIIWAVRRDSAWGAYCVFWMGAIIGVVLLQPGQVDNVLLITLPGYMLAAGFANEIFAPRIHQVTWLLTVGLLLAGGLVLVNIARYSRLIVYQPQQLANVWMALLVFVSSAVIIYFFATWDLRTAYQSTLLAAYILFTIYYWGNAWWLSHQAANDPRARWANLATDDEVRGLLEVAKDISRQVTGTDFGLEILNEIDSPVLRWYLRDFSNLENANFLPPNAQNPVFISRLDSEPLLANDYVGADFGLLRTGQQSLNNSSEPPLLATMRWWLFHETTLAIDEERVILWWRADLAQE